MTDITTDNSAGAPEGLAPTTDILDTPAPNSTTPEAPVVDYKYVPSKFLEDGKPNWEKLSSSYTELEKTIRSTRPTAAKSADEYTFDLPDNAPITFDETRNAEFKKAALEQGISPDQYKWMMNTYIGELQASMPTQEQAQAELTKAWGADTEANLLKAGKAWNAFGNGSDIAEHPVIGNNPILLQMLAKIGEQLGEDTSTSTTSTPQSKMSEYDFNQWMSTAIKDGSYYTPAGQKIAKDYFGT